MTARPVIEFWFDFASTYSYLSAMRISELADMAGVDVAWRPFLLGPIFSSQGWDTSPFNVYRNKGRNMWRDIARRSARYGLSFKRPDKDDARAFPQHSVLAARLGLLAEEEGKADVFCRAVFKAEFELEQDISDPSVLGRLAVQAELATDAVDRATSPENKQKLRTRTEQAMGRGIFGAPTFFAGDELFWGDDRLEDALDWAIGKLKL